MSRPLAQISAKENCQRKDCAFCIVQFVPGILWHFQDRLKHIRVDPEKAKEVSAHLAAQATRDWHYLRERLRTDGDAVRSKWTSLTRNKRESLILEAQPDKNGPPQTGWFSETQRNGLLVPSLNVETLKGDPSRLLSLLHHRSEFSLEGWASFDAQQFRLGFHLGYLADHYSEKCVIMHGKDYGRLVEWDREDCHSWMIIGYPLAKLILEAQSLLLGFLRRIVDLLVRPGSSHSGNARWMALTSSGFKASGQVELWSPYSNQVFSAPPSFDPHKCLSQATSTLAAAQDHLHFLQTDPRYLQKCMELRKAKIYSNANPKKIWESLANDLILVGPPQGVRIMRWIVDQNQYVVELHEKHKDSIRPFSPLPVRYEVAMAVLRHMCSIALEDSMSELRFLLPRSGGFARNYVYAPDKEGTACSMLKLKSSDWDAAQKEMYREDSLHWALRGLEDDPRDLLTTIKSFLMGFLDDCMADQRMKQRIDEPIYRVPSKLSLYHSIIRSIDQHRPRVRHLDADKMLIPREEERLAIRSLGRGPRTPTKEEQIRVSFPLQKVCEIPWPKGEKYRQWHEQVQLLRQRLADLWAAVRPVIRKTCEEAVPDGPMRPNDIETEVELVSDDLKPEYEAEKQAESREVSAAIQAMAVAKESARQTLWGEEVHKLFEMPSVRTKDKTRPEKALRVESETNAVEVAKVIPDEAPATRIEVNAKSLRILTKLFHSTDEANTKRGNTDWKDFVTAMADVGFAATHCGGSAVSFDPVESAPMRGHGSIVFHKPHPEPSIDPVILRIMGQRLRKWFGWERDTFVERVKKGPGV